MTDWNEEVKKILWKAIRDLSAYEENGAFMVGYTDSDVADEALAKIKAATLGALKKELIKSSIHYTEDGLAVDGLDPWAIPVSAIDAMIERLK